MKKALPTVALAVAGGVVAATPFLQQMVAGNPTLSALVAFAAAIAFHLAPSPIQQATSESK